MRGISIGEKSGEGDLRPVEQTLFYKIVERPSGRRGIKCRACDLTSWHPEDVANRYCGNCHSFHDLNIRQMKSAGIVVTAIQK